MKTLALSTASRSLAEYASELDDEVVLLTKRNRPIGRDRTASERGSGEPRVEHASGISRPDRTIATRGCGWQDSLLRGDACGIGPPEAGAWRYPFHEASSPNQPLQATAKSGPRLSATALAIGGRVLERSHTDIWLPWRNRASVLRWQRRASSGMGKRISRIRRSTVSRLERRSSPLLIRSA